MLMRAAFRSAFTSSLTKSLDPMVAPPVVTPDGSAGTGPVEPPAVATGVSLSIKVKRIPG